MSPRRYAHVPAPWRAAVDVSSGPSSRFYAALIRQALRYRLPARGRFGGLGAFIGRRDVPQRLLVQAFRVLPTRPRPDLDRLLDRVADAWGTLVDRSPRLPPELPELSALALRRSAGLTVFVFGEPDAPLVVLKVPSSGDPRVEVEMGALGEAEPAHVAPRPLGRLGPARVQEGLNGEALRIEPITPETVGSVRWSAEHASVAQALTRLARTASRHAPVDELSGPLGRAISDGPLGQPSRRLLMAARRDLARLQVSVLRHGDLSPQNCLLSGDRLVGLVDWETATSRGAPGFDVWNAAVAWFEHGVGLARWSEGRALGAFEAAWPHSPFWSEARGAAREAARAAEVPERFLDPLEVAFFGRRLGLRVEDPERYPTGPRTAAKMLELACAR